MLNTINKTNFSGLCSHAKCVLNHFEDCVAFGISNAFKNIR